MSKKTSTQRILTFIYGIFQWTISLLCAIVIIKGTDFSQNSIYKIIFHFVLVIYLIYLMRMGNKKLNKSIK